MYFWLISCFGGSRYRNFNKFILIIMNLKKPTTKGKDDFNRLRMVLDYRWDPKYQPQHKPANFESFKILREPNPIATDEGRDL